MRKLVGKRENYDSARREAKILAEAFILINGPRPTVIEYPNTCNSCHAPITVTLTEDISTGEIWLEGPDNCPNCNFKISDETAKTQPLTQAAIIDLFGDC